jgi:hypothetical protein
VSRVGDRRLLRWSVGSAFTLVTLAYGAHWVWGRGRDGLDAVFDDWVQNALLLGGAVLGALGAARKGERRVPWVLVTAGLACWAAANVVWSVGIGSPPAGTYPSLPDALWLGSYPFMYAALVMLVRERVAHFHPSVWLDGLIGALAMASVAIGVLWPGLPQAGEGEPLSVVVNFAYPLGDVLLLTLLAAVIALTRGTTDRALGLVAAGLLLNTIADVAYLIGAADGGDDAASFLDVVWVVAHLLIAAAAW